MSAPPPDARPVVAPRTVRPALRDTVAVRTSRGGLWQERTREPIVKLRETGGGAVEYLDGSVHTFPRVVQVMTQRGDGTRRGWRVLCWRPASASGHPATFYVHAQAGFAAQDASDPARWPTPTQPPPAGAGRGEGR